MTVAGEHPYRATVAWRREAPEADFAKGRYSRGHSWRFDGGVEVRAAASPHVVPKAFTPADAVDPEEAFVASLSSCHLLTFLDLARRAGFVIDSYDDDAEGFMEKNAAGRLWIARVVLRPRIAFSGKEPSPAELERLHHDAHDTCYIANSVTTDVRVEPPAG
jgi:organic hydroperoxide reductase OsmC/OhrA